MTNVNKNYMKIIDEVKIGSLMQKLYLTLIVPLSVRAAPGNKSKLQIILKKKQI